MVNAEVGEDGARFVDVELVDLNINFVLLVGVDIDTIVVVARKGCV